MVCVERKMVSDLIHSLRNKQANGRSRALNQFARLAREFPPPAHAVLLIEGRFDPSVDLGQWSWNAVDNFLLTVQNAGVRLVHCERKSLGDRLRSLREYFDKGGHSL